MLEFETTNVWNHSIYGYLFLKYMPPLSDYAEAILYHHSSWKDIQNAHIQYGDYAAMIHLADRMDVAFTYHSGSEALIKLLNKSKALFRPDYFETAIQCIKNHSILPQLIDHSYRAENFKLCKTFHPSTKEALDYLKMVVYSIDFRSDHTVTHTINTVAIAVNIARNFHISEDELENIYLGALLHDIGKIAIPLSILESPGRLNDEDMFIMRTHVEETGYLIKGIVPDEIYQLAMRHHEKLDGSGYPEGLCAHDLTFPQRIVAVADIVSALSSRRSYKDPFPKEKTLSIIEQMGKTQLDPDICQYICTSYDQIMEDTDNSRIQVIDMYQHIVSEYERMMSQQHLATANSI